MTAWFAANPQALTGPAVGISDLARAMCRDNERGNDANYEAYKGRAHRLFHDFRAQVGFVGGTGAVYAPNATVARRKSCAMGNSTAVSD